MQTFQKTVFSPKKVSSPAGLSHPPEFESPRPPLFLRILLLPLVTAALAFFVLRAAVRKKKILVIAMKIGNMGNGLFLYANALAFALENDFEVLNPSFHEYADYFETRGAPRRSFLAGVFYDVVRETAGAVLHFPENPFLKTVQFQSCQEILDLESEDFLESIRGKKTVFLQGWPLMSPKNMEKHSESIRARFRPGREFQDAVEAPVKKLREQSEVVLGVVIRQGDYRQWRNGKYFFETGEYVEVMRRALELFPGRKTGFFICSDEAQDERVFEGFRFVFRGGHDLENRYSLALCDFMISPPSTYAGWASFYGKVPYYVMTDPRAPLQLKLFKRTRNLNF